MLSRPIVALVGVTMLGPPIPLQGQDRVIDSGVFLVTRAGATVGREQFAIREGRPDGGRGYSMSVQAYYPSDQLEPVLAPLIEFGPDSQPVLVQLVELAGRQRRLLAEVRGRRLTVRAVNPVGESVREYPAGDRLLLADDSLIALYALLPGRAEGSLRQVWPRGERRETTNLRDAGTETIPFGEQAVPLQHYVLGSGDKVRHLWFDERGRLMKVEIPGLGISAIRTGSLPPR